MIIRLARPFAALFTVLLLSLELHSIRAADASATEPAREGKSEESDKNDKWDFKLMTKDTSDIYVVRNAIAIGGQSGWHSHPGPSLITVTIGEVKSVMTIANPHYHGDSHGASHGKQH